MKSTLPSLRLEKETIELMNRAIVKYNKKNLVKVNVQSFRRISLELLSRMILEDHEIPVDITQS